ncbi:MAG: hypothetical protein H7144_03690, partial [Burkholderiales bacterium]|nr:hypothetical protein [Phycisphaerae bacterium]
MLIAIWDTTHLLIWAATSREDFQPRSIADVRTLLGDLAGDSLLVASAEEAQIAIDLPDARDVPVPALRLSPADAMDLLTSLPEHLPMGCSDSMRVWTILARIVVRAMSAQQFYPSLRHPEGRFDAVWQPLLGGRAEVENLERFAHAMPGVCRAMNSLRDVHPLRLVETFLSETTDAL